MPERSSLAQSFAQRLAEIRQLRGLSQRVLGERLGLSKKLGSSRINRYESGLSFGTAQSLEGLAAVLDVPAACLLADTPELSEAILALGSDRKLLRAVLALSKLPAAERQARLRRLLEPGDD